LTYANVIPINKKNQIEGTQKNFLEKNNQQKQVTQNCQKDYYFQMRCNEVSNLDRCNTLEAS